MRLRVCFWGGGMRRFPLDSSSSSAVISAWGCKTSPVAGHGGLFAFARVGMWLFYLPSQVLITLSAGKK